MTEQVRLIRVTAAPYAQHPLTLSVVYAAPRGRRMKVHSFRPGDRLRIEIGDRVLVDLPEGLN